MASLAAALRCSPEDLLDLDLVLFDATVKAVGERERALSWGQSEELLATLIEVTHAHYQSFIQVNSKKGSNAGKPLRIPRPYDEDGSAPVSDTPVVSHGEIASLTGGKRG